jgi:acetyltransferase-like isoleucine patch superfamily enzyme
VSAVQDSVFIHDRALVESDSIGSGTRIWAFAHVMEGAVIGRDCNICDHTFVEGDVILGDRVTIKSGVYLWDGLRVEDDVFIGPQATFTNDRFPRSRQPFDPLPTTLRRGASIGAGAVILPGVTVGERAMIGAGAVVIEDVPADVVVVGNPARVLTRPSPERQT